MLKRLLLCGVSVNILYIWAYPTLAMDQSMHPFLLDYNTAHGKSLISWSFQFDKPTILTR